MWHIHGQKHGAADGLFCKSFTNANLAEGEAEEDIDDFMLTEQNSFYVLPISLNEPTPILADNYLKDSWKIATHLTTLRQLFEINTKELNAFKKKGVKFKV